jgi:hypothetical protein
MSCATQPLLSSIIYKVSGMIRDPPYDLSLLVIWIDIVSNILTPDKDHPQLDLHSLASLEQLCVFNSIAKLLESYESQPKIVHRLLKLLELALSRGDSFSEQARKLVLQTSTFDICERI